MSPVLPPNPLALVLLPLLAAVAVLGGSAPADAATTTSREITGRIGSIGSYYGQLDIPMTLTGLPDTQVVDLASVAVELDGHRVEAEVSTDRAEHTRVSARREVMLLVDVSGSMQGSRLAQAKTAAADFVGSLPPDVAVGLTSFSDTVTLLHPPSDDRAALLAALGQLRAGGDTALHDGLVSAVRTLGRTGERTVILLTDGADTASAASLDDAVAAVEDSDVALSAIAVEMEPGTRTGLESLSAAGRGQLLTTENGETLAAAFRAAAREFTEQLLVTAQVPPELAGREVAVRVTVVAGNEIVTADGTAQIGAVPPGLNSSGLRWGLGALFAGLVVLLGLGLASLVGRNDKGERTRRLVAAYTINGQPATHLSAAPRRSGVRLDESPVARTALAVSERVVAWRGQGVRLARRLDQAALPFEPREWLLLQAGVALAAGLVLLVVAGGGFLTLVLGAVLGGLAAGAWLRWRAGRRKAAFEDALPDALQLITGGLKTGYSLPQALDSVVRSGSEPVAAEFGRALAESRLGVPLEDCLDTVADRMECEDLRWVVMAVRIQREVGGNLAEVIGTTFETMRERARLRRQVRTLSAEGRMSALVLICLPIFMAAYQFLFRRDYMRPLYTERIGITMIVITVIMVTVGALWTKKLVKVEM